MSLKAATALVNRNCQVREAEERVASAYADLAVTERELRERNKRLRHYLRLGGLHWPSRVGWAQAVIMELERRVVTARSALVTALAEYSARCGKRESRPDARKL